MKRWWAETLLAVLVPAAFLGCLGSVELWGKREQRAAAEAIDTVDHDHWRVAQIQGRPRLEKPPLPRWSIAALIKLTGCRDERIVRLPGAVAGALSVALVYLLGLRMGGRELARASALVLCSSAFFVGEMRQASNDCLLALFTTLALYAAWRALEGTGEYVLPRDRFSGSMRRSKPAAALSWRLVFYSALGLGFLTKGPVIVLLVAVTLVPYLALGRRLFAGLRLLGSGWGVLIFAALAFCWPVAVWLQDPAAVRVWTLEMTEKTGLSQILEHRRHPLLLTQWPGMVLPWTLIAPMSVVLPFFLASRDRARRSGSDQDAGSKPAAFFWFPWWWGVGNLALFCLLVGREAQLLRAVHAGNGFADRRGVDRTGADWTPAGDPRHRHPSSRRAADAVGLVLRRGGHRSARRARSSGSRRVALVCVHQFVDRRCGCLERLFLEDRGKLVGPRSINGRVRDRFPGGLRSDRAARERAARPSSRGRTVRQDRFRANRRR